MITPNHQKHFQDQGYVILRNLVPQEYIQSLSAIANELTHNILGNSADCHFVDSKILMRSREAMAIAELSTILDFAVKMLGWNIRVSYADLVLTNPEPVPYASIQENGFDSSTGMGIHRDSAKLNDDLGDQRAPMFSLKCGVAISDISEKGRGNMVVYPGTHLQSHAIKKDEQLAIKASDAVQVCLNAGDGVMFDRRILHGRSSNTSTFQRKMLFVEYAHRWLVRKIESPIIPEDWIKSPLQNQLFGNPTTPWSLYWPSDDEVPLRSVQATDHSIASIGEK